MVTTHNRPLHMQFENLPPIDEDSLFDSSQINHQPHYATLGKDHSTVVSLLSSGQAESESITTLEEQRLLYEAMIASMRDEVLSFKGKASGRLRTMRNKLKYLQEEKETLLTECEDLEERIAKLSKEWNDNLRKDFGGGRGDGR